MQGAAAFLEVNVEEVRALSELICGGIPEAVIIEPSWRRDERSFDFSNETQPIRFNQKFRRDETGALFVDFQVLVLDGLFQGQGLGLSLVKSSLPAYDRLGIRYAACYANFEVGGYAWAKLGGAPTSPQSCRTALQERLSTPAIRASYTEAEFSALETVIASAQDECLMFDVANTFVAGSPPRSLGKDLLLGFAWDAVWDLDDSAQRGRLQGALA